MECWVASDINSCVRYGMEDECLALTINHQLFTHKGIDELIEKLKELQKQVKETDHGAV